MTKTPNPKETRSIQARLLKILTEFRHGQASTDLRSDVRALIPALQLLRKLGTSLIPAEMPTSARERILHYFNRYPGVPIQGSEIEIVAGISEWARRLRELRVQLGWPIINGLAAREMQESEVNADAGTKPSKLTVNEYILLNQT